MSTRIIDVLGVIQARMGSSRLPSKMMLELCGKPLLEHIFDRMKLSKKIDRLILATSDTPTDDVLEDLAAKNNIDCFRGSEDDVLDRFVQAMKKYNPEHVVRICADNPLIDPAEVDKIIEHHIKADADYSFNHIPCMNNEYPDGIGADVFRAKVLETVHQVTAEPRHREHIDEYIWDHLDKFKVETLKADDSIARPDIRLDVDTQADFDFIRSIFDESYPKSRCYISTLEVVTLLDKRATKKGE